MEFADCWSWNLGGNKLNPKLKYKNIKYFIDLDVKRDMLSFPLDEKATCVACYCGSEVSRCGGETNYIYYTFFSCWSILSIVCEAASSLLSALIQDEWWREPYARMFSADDDIQAIMLLLLAN